VSALAFFYPGVELVVAVKALAVRHASAEPVALRAVGYALVLGVRLCEFAGAYQRIDSVSGKRA